jgi:hypothetical protein
MNWSSVGCWGGGQLGAVNTWFQLLELAASGLGECSSIRERSGGGGSGEGLIDCIGAVHNCFLFLDLGGLEVVKKNNLR